MIERRSIVLTVVVLAMLFTGMFLYLFTKGELQQARLAVEDEEALEWEMPTEEQEEEGMEAGEEELTYAEAVAGVREEAEEEPVDVAPTAATGARGYGTLAAGLSILVGLSGLIRSWRERLASIQPAAR